MKTCRYLVILWVGVVLSAWVAEAENNIELPKLIGKLDDLKEKLQEVEQNMKITIEKVESKFETSINALKDLQTAMKFELQKNEQASKERYVNLQNRLAKLEKDVIERIDKVDSNIETKVQGLEDSLKKSLQTSEDNTFTKLEELKNLLIHQESSRTELKDVMPNIMPPPLPSCRQAPRNSSGKYMIKQGENTKPFEVLCEQAMFDGGWTVIQHRFNGSVDFYRDWTEYRNGFGSLDGEFWLGLEHIHQMTKNRSHELLVEVKDFHGNYGYAIYTEFSIGSESEMYVLKKLGTYSGTAGNAMIVNKNQKFSTFDRDNDSLEDGNCAEQRHGAWWYVDCSSANLNGRYLNTPGDMSAMWWYNLKNDFRDSSSGSRKKQIIRPIDTPNVLFGHVLRMANVQ
ncbi:AGAP011225-PA-like protein [Anopheles sinensis]|uniref:AGAP011225-PA-like protein n=1 Tax=Anopheles sinensis TaxID=74873 RepID=A0A084VKG9_ANOSI|nr:AGAP011225-PA-like protein [Anopheles sinensis]